MEAIMQEFAKTTKDVQDFWEKRVAQWMEECVKSQDFVQAMTRSLESSLDFRKAFDSTLTRWAETFHVVTKKDLSVIQQQMYDQNLRMEKMYNLMEELRDRLTKPVEAEAGVSGKKPSRAKKA